MQTWIFTGSLASLSYITLPQIPVQSMPTLHLSLYSSTLIFPKNRPDLTLNAKSSMNCENFWKKFSFSKQLFTSPILMLCFQSYKSEKTPCPTTHTPYPHMFLMLLKLYGEGIYTLVWSRMANFMWPKVRDFFFSFYFSHVLVKEEFCVLASVSK